MKKAVSIFVSLLFALGLSACALASGSSSEVPSTDSSPEPAVEEKYSFNNLYSFSDSITADNIQKVVYTSYPGSIVPPWLYSVSSTEKVEDFAKIADFADKAEFTVCNDLYCGIGGYIVDIVLRNGDVCTVKFSTKDEFYLDGDGYKCSLEFPVLGKTEYCYFTCVTGTQFKSFNSVKDIDKSYISDIHIMPVTPVIAYLDLTKDATLLVDYEQFVIISARMFRCHNEYYEVVGEKDFSDLLEGIEDSTSFLTVKDESGTVFLKILVSNNIEYTAAEILVNLPEWEMLYDENGNIFESGEINCDTTLIIKNNIV